MGIAGQSDPYRMYLAKVDMRLLSHFADCILENGAEAYIQRSINIKMALKIALLVCYARPFLENDGAYGDREESMENQLTQGFCDEERIIHRNILDMRTREIRPAHISVSDLENIASNIVHIALSRRIEIPLEFTIVASLKKMADKIYITANDIVEHALADDVGIIMQPANEV